MMCLFNSTKNAKTNEEYAKVLQKRIPYLILIIVLGILTASIAICNEIWGFMGNILTIDSHSHNMSLMNGVYTGLGAALTFMSIGFIIRTKKIMKNESLLKEERLKTQDERNQMIAAKAVQSAAATMLVCSYLFMLIAGFYSRIVFFCFWGIVAVFLVSYHLFKIYYNRKL